MYPETNVLLAALILLFACTTIFKKDFWPFTRYPMFSRYRDPARASVISFALETTDGHIGWWRPRFHRYPEHFGSMIAADNRKVLPAAIEILRLLRLENDGGAEYAAIHVIERRWIDNCIRDRTVAVVPVKALPHVT